MSSCRRRQRERQRRWGRRRPPPSQCECGGGDPPGAQAGRRTCAGPGGRSGSGLEVRISELRQFGRKLRIVLTVLVVVTHPGFLVVKFVARVVDGFGGLKVTRVSGLNAGTLDAGTLDGSLDADLLAVVWLAASSVVTFSYVDGRAEGLDGCLVRPEKGGQHRVHRVRHREAACFCQQLTCVLHGRRTLRGGHRDGGNVLLHV